MSELIILSIPFLGTSLGAAMVFFVRDKIAPKLEKLLLGFAAGVMIAASVWSLLIPRDWLASGIGGISAGHRIFADTGYGHSTSAFKKPRTGGTSFRAASFVQDYNDAVCGDASQHSGRNVCGGCLCRKPDTGSRYHRSRCFGTGTWHCHSEFSGGSDYFPAPLRRGNEPEKSICMWRFVRNRRTNRRLYYDSDRRTNLTGAAISSGICGRSYDVCRDRGVDSGMSGWNAQ